MTYKVFGIENFDHYKEIINTRIKKKEIEISE